MSIPSVRYFARTTGTSGYASASRAFALALSGSNVNTKFEIKSNHSDFSSKLKDFSGSPDIDLYLNMPPFGLHKSKNYKIGYFYWEADTLPTPWRTSIKFLDEVWAPCELVASACRRAGFKGPIEVVPTPSLWSPSDLRVAVPSPVSSELLISDDVFIFYSIFQWQERKGYKELLTAYYEEFGPKDKVLLLIKTNKLDQTRYKKEQIYIDIINIKRRLNKKFYPKVYLIDERIPFEQIKAIHNYGDCYVTSHHGEGWGMPIHDAIEAGNHLITTKFGGITEFLDENSANIIAHKIGPVKGMDWQPLYDKNQNWAYPSVSSLRKNMRNVFDNNEDISDKIINAKNISKTMTIAAVGSRMEEILKKDRFKKYD
jgi:hypothetical protein